mmetsp:Transcript_24996/g.54810  ORF Transcript_24996/g.54810 Transcript_24996/m.54810 type:complete len:313 (-) Transcript_24996:1110-2048(-)|eukprot:CAMPEP_0168191672 /NCGR_PEP_ID=MMETSP0139_2-20121125/17644_1 /TAXON_ID=44445 /ORGANISM="Pseudo-nitzschia australis, Strain 10249 10 AB" /LENGTH=312 /DNA_ID=CAMNT_0008114869 /DNA_START=112 /DNA_END=1050 /DNA_ORIENTATION=-
MSKTLQRNLKAKIPKGLDGPEWDSSDEEGDEPVLAENQTKTKKSTKSSSQGKKVVKYDGGKDGGEDEKDLVLYIGHLPKDLDELDLRRFVSQFGKVYNCRIARKIETGKPKGFAFIRFGDNETAKIVCETLHGYFLEKQRLVCQLRPSHPGMFFNTVDLISKRTKKIQLEGQQRNKNLANSEKCKVITTRLVSREKKKRDRLKELGIDYDFPGYKSNRDDFNEYAPEKKTDAPQVEEKESESGKKKRRKESIDSTHSEGSASKDKTKKKKKRDSIDSITSPSAKKEAATNDRLTQSTKKEKKAKNKKRRKSA